MFLSWVYTQYSVRCTPSSPTGDGDDSTAVCISEGSPPSGARVGGCLQCECVSEEQGMYVLGRDPIST